MSDYDIDKVSPRPWVTDDSNVEMVAILKNGIYHYIGACGADTTNYVDTMRQDESETNAAHIVHCVNMHDELVQALKDYIQLIDSGDAGFWEPTELRELLARAEGGAT